MDEKDCIGTPIARRAHSLVTVCEDEHLVHVLRRHDSDKRYVTRVSPHGNGRAIDHIWTDVETADSITFGTVDWHGLMLMFASDHGPVVGEFAPQTQAMPSQYASVTRPRDQFATMPSHKWSKLLNIQMDKDTELPKAFGIRYCDNNPKAKLLLAEIQKSGRQKDGPTQQAIAAANAALDEIDALLIAQANGSTDWPVADRTNGLPLRKLLDTAVNKMFQALHDSLPQSMQQKEEQLDNRTKTLKKWTTTIRSDETNFQVPAAMACGRGAAAVWVQTEAVMKQLIAMLTTALRQGKELQANARGTSPDKVSQALRAVVQGCGHHR